MAVKNQQEPETGMCYLVSGLMYVQSHSKQIAILKKKANNSSE